MQYYICNGTCKVYIHINTSISHLSLFFNLMVVRSKKTYKVI